MSENSYKVTLESGRQITIPSEVMEALHLAEGDQLELSIKDNGVFVKSRKQIAKEMLADIRQAFAESGISEEEFLEEGRRIREEPAVNSLAPIDATGRRGRHGGE